MGLVHDHQVPAHLPQARQDLLALGEVERGHHRRLLHPLVHAELGPQLAALQHHERLVELLLQLALPLEREVRRGDDQDALGKAAQLQLADEQSGHDRLPRPRVVGQQEPHARQLQQVVVDRLQLVRQRVDPRDRQPEPGVELPRDAERVRLQSQSAAGAVSVVLEAAVKNCQSGQLGRPERDPPEALGPGADQTERPAAGLRLGDGLHAHRLVEDGTGQGLTFGGGSGRAHRWLSCRPAPRGVPHPWSNPFDETTPRGPCGGAGPKPQVYPTMFSLQFRRDAQSTD